MRAAKRHRAGRKAVIATGVLVVAVAGLAVVYWKQVVARYHLERLRFDADYLLTIATAPAGAPERRAILDFLESPVSRGHLAELFVRTAVAPLERQTRQGRRRPTSRGLPARSVFPLVPRQGNAPGGTPPGSALTVIGVKDSSYSDPELWLWKLGAGRGNMSSRRCEDHLTLALHRFLETLDGDPPRRVPDDPALWYLVLPGRSLSGSLPESLKKIATRGSVCVLVRADGVPDLPLLGDAALPAILWFLGQGKEPLRAHAAYGLHNFPDRAAEIIPVLGGVLRDEATRVRRAAARALVSVVTSESEIAVPHLLSALDDGDALVRARAAMALGNTGHGPEPVVSALRRALRDEDGRVRFRAAQSLGELHPAANRAIPDLRAALEDSEGLVRHHAGRALARIRADAPEEDPGGAGSSRE